MREILSDVSEMLSDTDPVRRAQIKAKRPLPKRFYKSAGVAPLEDGFAVQLDGSHTGKNASEVANRATGSVGQ